MAIIEWRAPEFEYRIKGNAWYWKSIAIALVALGVAVWQKNFLFGFFVVVAEILVLAWADKKPKTLTLRADEHGIEIVGHKRYGWKNFEMFSVDENEGGEYPQLVFVQKGMFRFPVKMGVPKTERPDVESHIETFVARGEHEPSFLDDLERFLRF